MASKKLCLLKQVPDEELIGENSQALQKFLKNTKEFARDIEASSKNLFEKLLLDIQNEGQRTMPEQLLAFIEDTIRVLVNFLISKKGPLSQKKIKKMLVKKSKF